jgi:hypothetical protein
MRDAAADLDFETAARLRDEIKRLKAVELDLMDDPMARGHTRSSSAARSAPVPTRTPPRRRGRNAAPARPDGRDGSCAVPLPLWKRTKNHALGFSQVIDFLGEGACTAARPGPPHQQNLRLGPAGPRPRFCVLSHQGRGGTWLLAPPDLPLRRYDACSARSPPLRGRCPTGQRGVNVRLVRGERLPPYLPR